MKSRYKTRILALLLSAIMVFAVGCSTSNDNFDIWEDTTDTNATANTTLASGELDISVDTYITLNGSSIEIDGNGASANGSVVTITSGGAYAISGYLTDGQVLINAPSTDTVQIILSGVDITSSTSAAIYALQSDEFIITLAEGSNNIIADAQNYTYSAAAAEEPDAAIFSKDDLTINGSGSLTVNANFKNGIATKDDLIITGGDYSIIAVKDALRGRDSVNITGGTFNLTAGGDGIQSNNDEDTAKGWVELLGGTYNIMAERDAIQAETTLAISAGIYNIITGGGSASAPAHAQQEDAPGGMGRGQRSNNAGETTTTNQNSSTESLKGLKAGGDVTITGGNFNIDSADDAIHSNANLTISGGSFTITTGDDAAHADGDLTVDGASEITVTACYEGLEGNNVYVNNGNINILASDDGINAAGGSDGDTLGNTFGSDRFRGGGDYEIVINGGIVKIVAGYDGLDSNGSITINSGEVNINGSMRGGGDAAIDCDGRFTVNGGKMTATGASAFAMMGNGDSSINSNGSQVVLNLQFSNTQEEGALIELKDSGGNVLITYTADKQFKTIAFSSPDMKDKGSYTVAVNGSDVTTVTLSGWITSITDTGQSIDAGMDGGRGGMMPGGTAPDGATSGGRGGGPMRPDGAAGITPPNGIPESMPRQPQAN